VLEKLGIVDHTIEEPKGGAHRDVDLMATRIKKHLIEELRRLQDIPVDELLNKRYQRLMSYGN
jgi:acetyl-CoA carboxylase carboxyl transferase subunit alpha